MQPTNNKNNKQRKGPAPDLSNIIYGKVPPQAVPLEEAILGASIIEYMHNTFETVLEKIKVPEVFYSTVHQEIFSAMYRLHTSGKPTEMLLVIEELKRVGKLEECGGPYVINKLTTNVVSSAQLPFHCNVVFEKYIQRECIRVGGILISEGYEAGTDAFELLDRAEREIFAIANAAAGKVSFSTDALLVRFLQELERKRGMGGKITGVSSGIKAIDKVSHGWQPSDLIILAARPSVGKTALALQLALNCCLSNTPEPVAFFSLEMTASQLIQRASSNLSGVEYSKISRGNLTEEEMNTIYSKAVQRLAKAPLFIDDTHGINIFELRAKCRRQKAKHGLGLIIVDYLQLMSGVGSTFSREQEISAISRGLKSLAKELNVPIIALSQLSRQVETRTGSKMPVLSDLRESGAIEQDADAVLFMYRPEYHNIHKDETGKPTTGETELRFAKHRNGTLETVKLKALLWIQKFVEWEETGMLVPSHGINFEAVAQAKKSMGQLDELPEDLPF